MERRINALNWLVRGVDGGAQPGAGLPPCGQGLGCPGIRRSENVERVYPTRNEWPHNQLCTAGVLQSHRNCTQAALGTGFCYPITTKFD